ncbi:MAG TPA: DNA-directed RNA polymerase subunit N [Methanocorpusculum sp.]|nr:DNA-directed RNA polymerase subunit N [Methanocorpusculum sp.]HJJ40048.1 DNA-directed RNA polymerase subunit N [Methanocorpusculum sp.]HJJ49531.1 DNA-directed RNA polymerase subunit N [Methanocorpusculum sp.]HJJ57083.1 DNA-directed RNA polymerase subunit N [Methanocorpusculum sp.]HJJ95001.1 DNA-directed RNA polymerase subunit N [Methanocorpusculum sp.]
MIPVRCFTCGKVISIYWDEYQQRVAAGEDPKEILDSMGLDRYCCRRMLISHKETDDEMYPYT